MSHDVFYGPGSAYHRKRQHLREQTISCLECAIVYLGKPESMLDAGCGEGVPVLWSQGQGIRAMGVDLACPDGLPEFQRHNLTVPLTLPFIFEWVICWEVAEHLPGEAAGVLCDTLARHMLKPTGRLLFSAASPGQRGDGHINCQPQSYWRALLQDRGLRWQARESEVLGAAWLREAPKAPWYGRNLQIFAWT